MNKIRQIGWLLGCLLFFMNVSAQEVVVVDFKGLQPLLQMRNDTTYVVNFWATWCKPCVEELPAFEQVNKKYKNEKLKVLLVSLDFIKRLESHLKPFLIKHQIQSSVFLLNDPNANAWIDLVEPSWSGAIPATLIYRQNQRVFHEGSYTFPELEALIQRLMQFNGEDAGRLPKQ